MTQELLTLEEAIDLLAERGAYLTRHLGVWYIEPSPDDLEPDVHWDNLLSGYLDRPVVARDPAAELRAALEAAERALDRAGASLLHDNYEQQERFYETLQAAHDEVCAALAATEGES